MRRYAYVARWLREQSTLVVAPRNRDVMELLAAQRPSALWVVDTQARKELKPALAGIEGGLLTWGALAQLDAPKFSRICWLDTISALDDDALQWILHALEPSGCFVYRHSYQGLDSSPSKGNFRGADRFWTTVNRLQCSFDAVELRAELELSATSVCPVQAHEERPQALVVEDLLLRDDLECAAYWCFCAFDSGAIPGGEGATWVVEEPRDLSSLSEGASRDAELLPGSSPGSWPGSLSDSSPGSLVASVAASDWDPERTPAYIPNVQSSPRLSPLEDAKTQPRTVLPLRSEAGPAPKPSKPIPPAKPSQSEVTPYEKPFAGQDSLCPSPSAFLEQVNAQRSGAQESGVDPKLHSEELFTDLSVTTARLVTAQHRIGEYQNAMRQAKEQWEQWHRVQVPEYQEQITELERRVSWLREDLRKSRSELLQQDEELQAMRQELQAAQERAQAEFERAEHLRRLILSALDDDAGELLDSINKGKEQSSLSRSMRPQTSRSAPSAPKDQDRPGSEPSSAELLRALHEVAAAPPRPMRSGFENPSRPAPRGESELARTIDPGLAMAPGAQDASSKPSFKHSSHSPLIPTPASSQAPIPASASAPAKAADGKPSRPEGLAEELSSDLAPELSSELSSDLAPELSSDLASERTKGLAGDLTEDQAKDLGPPLASSLDGVAVDPVKWPQIPARNPGLDGDSPRDRERPAAQESLSEGPSRGDPAKKAA